MSKSIAVILICLLPLSLPAADQPIGGIKLLDGYKIKKERAVDAAAWTIYKDGGLSIEYEAGMNEGLWADAKQRSRYLWYREQVVNGHKVMLALTKPGFKTVWEPDNPRNLELGNILLVTFPLGIQADHTANFK